MTRIALLCLLPGYPVTMTVRVIVIGRAILPNHQEMRVPVVASSVKVMVAPLGLGESRSAA